MNQDIEPCSGTESRIHIDPLYCVTLENEKLQVKILPELGGKIASILLKRQGAELLQQPLMPYAPRTRETLFEDTDASGIDECLPTVAPSHLITPDGLTAIPDHGDFWQIPFTCVQEGSAVTLEADGSSLPLFFRRTITLEEHSILFSYQVQNTSAHTVPYLWSAHPAFSVDPGDHISLPTSVREVTVEESNRLSLQHFEGRYKWPHALDNSGQSVDLSYILGPEYQIADKLFTPSPSEGWAAIERLQIRQRIVMHFNPQQAPYLGMWLCFGGWPIGKPLQQQCVALEPCTAPFDSLSQAIERGYARELPAYGSDAWQISIEVHSMD